MYVYVIDDTQSDLAIRTLADSSVQRLTETPDVNESSAEWTPDGETIVFRRGRAWTGTIVTVDVGELIGQ